MDRIVTKHNPKMFDKAVLPIQNALASAFPWLDHVIGICETLIDKKDNKPFKSANYYIGGGQYEQIMPCEELGNFSFFYLRDPQVTMAKDKSLIKSPISLVVWYNVAEVSSEYDERNREQIKGQILGVLDSLHLPYFTITKIWENPTNVFTDFSYDQAENQFLMHPFAGLRIDGEIIARLECEVPTHEPTPEPEPTPDPEPDSEPTPEP